MADLPIGLDSSSLMTLAQAAQQGLQQQPQPQLQPQQQPFREWTQRDPPSAYAAMPLHDVVPDRPLVTEEMHAEMVRLVGVRALWEGRARLQSCWQADPVRLNLFLPANPRARATFTIVLPQSAQHLHRVVFSVSRLARRR
jgi:hypothetical protein